MFYKTKACLKRNNLQVVSITNLFECVLYLCGEKLPRVPVMYFMYFIYSGELRLLQAKELTKSPLNKLETFSYLL